jgi:hypothetical protein
MGFKEERDENAKPYAKKVKKKNDEMVKYTVIRMF